MSSDAPGKAVPSEPFPTASALEVQANLGQTALGSGRGVVLVAATVLASMVGFLDASVVNVAVPAIGTSFGSSVATLQWVLTSYLVTVAALLLVSGALADRFGRRRILTIGLVIVAVSAILCAIAPNAPILITARVLQGVGGALTVPSSLALLNGALREQDRSRGIGIWSGISTLATTVGPYAGGWLLDHSTWRWLFLLNVPLCVLAIVALRFVPRDVPLLQQLTTDVVGVALAIIGLGGIIFALTTGASNGWTSPVVIGFGIAGILALVLLAPVERRAKHPMLRLSVFRSRRFNAINLSTFFFYATVSGMGFLVTEQALVTLGYNAAQAGALLLPGSVVFLLMSPVSGQLATRFDARWLMTIGMSCAAVAVLVLSFVQQDSQYATDILPATLLFGFGLGLAITPLTAAVLASVPVADLGAASAINNVSSRIGGAIAIAVLPAAAGATAGRSLEETLSAGYSTAMLIAAALAVIAALIAALFVHRQTSTPFPALKEEEQP